VTGKSQYAKELLSEIEAPGRLLRLWEDGERAVRGYIASPEALLPRIEILKLKQHVAHYCHELTMNAHPGEEDQDWGIRRL
jgi:hypothetical protein